MSTLPVLRNPFRRLADPQPQTTAIIARDPLKGFLIDAPRPALIAPPPAPIEEEAEATGIVSFPVRVKKWEESGAMSYTVALESPAVNAIMQTASAETATLKLPFSLARHLAPMGEYTLTIEPRRRNR